jgi:hypothetical protein
LDCDEATEMLLDVILLVVMFEGSEVVVKALMV